MLTDAEKKFISDNCHLLKDREIAEALTRLSGRTVSTHTVKDERGKLGIVKVRGNGPSRIVSRPARDPEIE